jgi:hypothetical protein
MALENRPLAISWGEIVKYDGDGRWRPDAGVLGTGHYAITVDGADKFELQAFRVLWERLRGEAKEGGAGIERPCYVPDDISDEAVAFMRRCGVIREDSSIDASQVCREMSDFQRVIGQCSEVYAKLSGGLVSKPLTDPEVVIRFSEEREERETAEAIKDATEELRDELETTKAELKALYDAACLTSEEEELAIDGECQQLLDSLSPRLGEAIGRVHKFLNAETAGKEGDHV